MAAHHCRPASPPDGTVRADRQSHGPFRPRSAAGKEANDHIGPMTRMLGHQRRQALHSPPPDHDGAIIRQGLGQNIVVSFWQVLSCPKTGSTVRARSL